QQLQIEPGLLLTEQFLNGESAHNVSPLSGRFAPLQVRFLLGNDPVKLLAVPGLDEALAHRRVFQQLGDAGKGFQMYADRLLRSNQEKKEVGGLAVHRIEIDSLPAATKGDQQIFDLPKLPVGDGHAVP